MRSWYFTLMMKFKIGDTFTTYAFEQIPHPKIYSLYTVIYNLKKHGIIKPVRVVKDHYTLYERIK